MQRKAGIRKWLTMFLLVRIQVGESHVSMSSVSVRKRVKNVGKRFGNDVGRF